jgi:hypothetical protein
MVNSNFLRMVEIQTFPHNSAENETFESVTSARKSRCWLP